MQSVPQDEQLVEIELSTLNVTPEVPENNTSSFDLRFLEQSMQWLSENASHPYFWKALGALVVIGVIIVSATGPSTCSTFYVTNELDETLYISQLSPYSAKFGSKTNHPVWSPKSFLSSGRVDISKGYGSEVKMRVDKYYTFGDDYFYLHMNANGKPEDFYVSGREGMKLTPSLGFFSCDVKLQNENMVESNSTETRYLRG